MDVPFAGHFVFHADGSYSKTDDLEIGGFVLSPQARHEALASGDPLVEAFADLNGKLPNSRSRTDDYAGGLGYVDARNIGVSIATTMRNMASLFASRSKPARVRISNSRRSTRTRRVTTFAPKSRCPAFSARFAYAAAGPNTITMN